MIEVTSIAVGHLLATVNETPAVGLSPIKYTYRSIKKRKLFPLGENLVGLPEMSTYGHRFLT